MQTIKIHKETQIKLIVSSWEKIRKHISIFNPKLVKFSAAISQVNLTYT